MNQLLTKLKALPSVPIPASTENPEMYWFTNNGTLQESEDAIVINASDPVTKQGIGGIAYVIHDGDHSMGMVRGISQAYERHPHVVTISEAMAEKSIERYGQVIWELCLTPVKVLGKVQEGYNPTGKF